MRIIILASSSPRRKMLLNQIGIKFTVHASKSDEKMNPRLKPRGQAEYLSEEKAKIVAKEYPDALIIAADTFVVFNDEIIGKPHTKANAKKTLQKLSGNSHMLITGITVMDTKTGKQITKSVETKVFMKKLTQKEIDGYIATEEPLDKAGAYAIQELGGIFIEKIEGSASNVIGLPLNELYETLKKFDIDILVT